MISVDGVRNTAGAEKRRRQCSERHKASTNEDRVLWGFVNTNDGSESMDRGNVWAEGAVIRKFRITVEGDKQYLTNHYNLDAVRPGQTRFPASRVPWPERRGGWCGGGCWRDTRPAPALGLWCDKGAGFRDE